jgi:hypothetical protein
VGRGNHEEEEQTDPPVCFLPAPVVPFSDWKRMKEAVVRVPL